MTEEQIIQEAAVTQVVENEATAAAQIAPVETDAEINWKKFRDARKQEREEALKREQEQERKVREERERAEAMRMALEALKEKPKDHSIDVAQGIIDDLDPEEFPTGSQVKKMMEREIKKAIQETIKQQEQERERQRHEEEQRNMPQRLKKEIPDFDSVMTSDNLDYLEYHYPEVAGAYAAMPESKDKWSMIYKAVKRFVPNSSVSDTSRDARLLERNSTKPQSLSTTGRSDVAEMDRSYISEQRKKDNWARMQQALKGN